MKNLSNALKVALLASFLFAGSQAYAGDMFSSGKAYSVSKKSGKKKKKSRKKKYGKKNPKVPIDGGLGVLLLGAAAFGVKKLRGANESNS